MDITPTGKFFIRISVFILVFWVISSYVVLNPNILTWTLPHRLLASFYTVFVLVFSYDSFKTKNYE